MIWKRGRFASGARVGRWAVAARAAPHILWGGQPHIPCMALGPWSHAIEIRVFSTQRGPAWKLQQHPQQPCLNTTEPLLGTCARDPASLHMNLDISEPMAFRPAPTA